MVPTVCVPGMEGSAGILLGGCRWCRQHHREGCPSLLHYTTSGSFFPRPMKQVPHCSQDRIEKNTNGFCLKLVP